LIWERSLDCRSGTYKQRSGNVEAFRPDNARLFRASAAALRNVRSTLPDSEEAF
jgi:hypothetical protein